MKAIITAAIDRRIAKKSIELSLFGVAVKFAVRAIALYTEFHASMAQYNNSCHFLQARLGIRPAR
jgi:hypothetical protein